MPLIRVCVGAGRLRRGLGGGAELLTERGGSVVSCGAGVAVMELLLPGRGRTAESLVGSLTDPGLLRAVFGCCLPVSVLPRYR
jgi:hypothetical protein